MLNAVEVKTCQDLYDKRGLLYHLYSQISFNYFMRICLGIGSTTVERWERERERAQSWNTTCSPNYLIESNMFMWYDDNILKVFFVLFAEMEKEKAWVLKGIWKIKIDVNIWPKINQCLFSITLSLTFHPLLWYR